MRAAAALRQRQEESETFDEMLDEQFLLFEKELHKDRGPFWLSCFIRWYKEDPIGNSDPRWNELFKEGMPALRRMLGKEGFRP